MTSINTGPAIFFNAKQLRDAEIEAREEIIYRHHSHAMDKLKILEDNLLEFSPETAIQSAFYIVFDVLQHMASCTSDEDELERLRQALNMLQYRITSFNHGVNVKENVTILTICSKPEPTVDLNHAVIPEQCLQRLLYIFATLRRLIKSRTNITDACQIIEQLNIDVISRNDSDITDT